MLNARQPYLQSLMMKKIQIRPTPTISFELDLGSEKAAGVEKALLDEETKNH
jgi:ribosome-binding factor A